MLKLVRYRHVKYRKLILIICLSAWQAFLSMSLRGARFVKSPSIQHQLPQDMCWLMHDSGQCESPHKLALQCLHLAPNCEMGCVGLTLDFGSCGANAATTRLENWSTSSSLSRYVAASLSVSLAILISVGKKMHRRECSCTLRRRHTNWKQLFL